MVVTCPCQERGHWWGLLYSVSTYLIWDNTSIFILFRRTKCRNKVHFLAVFPRSFFLYFDKQQLRMHSNGNLFFESRICPDDNNQITPLCWNDHLVIWFYIIYIIVFTVCLKWFFLPTIAYFYRHIYFYNAYYRLNKSELQRFKTTWFALMLSYEHTSSIITIY